MNKATRVMKVQEILEELIPNPSVPLHHKDHFTLLIAVLLSAQCTDERVNMVTPELFKMADTPEAMAVCPVEDIQRIIRSCGLSPKKARAISALSKILITEFKGKVPDTFEALESLPGVGHKTASVIMAQAFHQPAFPVDTHIFRCAKRWHLSQGKTVKQVEHDLKKLFPKERWTKLHLQIVLFARKYCPAKKHDPKQCPICSLG